MTETTVSILQGLCRAGKISCAVEWRQQGNKSIVIGYPDTDAAHAEMKRLGVSRNDYWMVTKEQILEYVEAVDDFLPSKFQNDPFGEGFTHAQKGGKADNPYKNSPFELSRVAWARGFIEGMVRR